MPTKVVFIVETEEGGKPEEWVERDVAIPDPDTDYSHDDGRQFRVVNVVENWYDGTPDDVTAAVFLRPR
jgi:hypothetical protein